MFITLLASNNSRLAFRQLIRPLATNSKSVAADANKASPEQLGAVEASALKQVPDFFKRPHKLDSYTNDIKFIDNIRGIKTVGTFKYALQLSFIRLYYSMKYSAARAEILNLVKNNEESYVRIRWRLIGKPGLIRIVILKFGENWKDGISTLYVNKEGKVHTHICDNIETDINKTGAKVDSVVNRGVTI